MPVCKKHLMTLELLYGSFIVAEYNTNKQVIITVGINISRRQSYILD